MSQVYQPCPRCDRNTYQDQRRIPVLAAQGPGRVVVEQTCNVCLLTTARYEEKEEE